jgi:filamentous hemagglutinin
MTDCLRRIICLILAFALTVNPMLASAGGIATDPAAPRGKQPGLTAAPNGVPMVNIAKPNGKGLSHNMYDEFNVGRPGVIMNNSRKTGRTQLGGVVVGNPNLGSDPEARVILNEVTGGSRSLIEGYTEIFGYPADYILANPNGVSINGGGFINTPRATVTTGRPRFDETGGLQALDVLRGDVLVDGQGLNAANLDAFDIVSRAAAINAAIYAKDISVTTGYGSYDPVTDQFTDLTPDSSPAPVVAIDTSALGGIYADRIKLVGNEKGLGINLDGIVRATDQLVLGADGRICVKGAASSDKNLSVASAADGVDISGTLAAGAKAVANAARDVRLAAIAGGEAPLLYAPDLSIAAGTLDNGGKVLADGSLKAVVSGDVANSGTISAGSDADLEAGGSVRNTGQIQAGQNLLIDAQAMIENPGKIHSAGSTSIRSGSVANSGDILANQDLLVVAQAMVENPGKIHSAGTASIRSGGLSNSGAILALGPVKIHSAREVSNTGRIAANGQVTISAGALANGGRVTSGQEMAVDLSGGLDNSGTIHSDSEVGIRAESLINQKNGIVQGLDDISIETRAGLENRGIVNAADRVEVQTAGTLANAGGSILAQSGMELTSLAGLENSGLIQSGGDGTFRISGALLNNGEILTSGNSVVAVSGQLTNTGSLHSGAGSLFDLGGDLRNDGDILAHGNLGLSVAGRLDNFGLMASDADASLAVGGILFNAMGGEILAFGAADFDVDGDLLNSGRIESNAPDSFDVDGMLVNDADGRILSEDGLGFGVSGSVRNEGIVHSGGSLDLTAASLDNDGQILAQGDSAVTLAGGLVNTNLIFAGGASTFSLAGVLRNIRGNILSLKDMLLQGLGADSPMAELLNESGTIETLEGSLAIRAKVVRNTNLDFTLTPGVEVLSRRGGIYSYYSDNWDQAQDLYEMMPGSSEVKSKRDALIVMTSELRLIGLDTDRNVYTREEIDAGMAATETRFAESGATPEEIAAFKELKSRVRNSEPRLLIKHIKRSSKVAGYIEEITRDEASGLAVGGIIAALADMDIEAWQFLNSVSRISTASGDISIRSGSFENSGQDIYETRTVDWIKGHANEHESPRLSPEGKGTEVVRTPIGHAYGIISAGGTVTISAEHLENGISGNAGVASGGGRDVRYDGGVNSQAAIVAPLRPEDLAHSVGDIGDLIGNLPKDGLFSVNRAPGHRYLIETNPALTSLARFYGSDYFLSQTGIDLGKTQQSLLGDAFYETRLVRDQIFALTGRRLLSPAFSSDAEQMLALMDNALAAREDLGLSMGVALTGEQIAALATDIVWLVSRVVDGHEVLVPVVYLCRNSLDTIARGGSVIIGNDVDISTTGDTTNRGVIKAAGNLAINAGNIFNTFGTIQGDTLTLAAADSIVNTSGLVRGRDVALSAEQDIVSTTAKTTFSTEEALRRPLRLNPFSGDEGASTPMFLGTLSTVRSTSETVGQRGSIEATGDLSMRAGRDVAVVGSDVKAGGDATIEAGRDVVIADQTLESRDKGKTRSSSSRLDIQTSKASNVDAGGSVTIDAGRDVSVHGSRVEAGQDVTISAGEDVTITSSTEGEKYRYKQKSDGGFFGTSKSLSVKSKSTANAESTITAGNRIVVEAGKDGAGTLTVAGSTLESGGDMSLKSADDLVIASASEINLYDSASSKSGLLSKESTANQRQGVSVARSELKSGGDVRIESGTSGRGDLIVHGSRVMTAGEAELKSASDLLITADRDQSSSHFESKDSGFASLTPSMEMTNHLRTTTVGSEIAADGKVALKAKDNVAIQAATIKSGESVSITATEGQVALLTGRDTGYDQKVTQKTGLLTWKSTDKGKSAEIVVPTIIQTDQGLSIRAGNGVMVEYRQTGDVRHDVQQLAQNPGLEWMGPLLERKDINWQAVQDNFTRWNKTDSGLAPVATLVIAIAAAAATAGAASSLALSVMGLEVSTLTGAVVVAGTQAAATSVQLAMLSALTAGITSIGSRLAVSVADAAAGGDLGKNLENMVSEESARALLTTMVTAGVMGTTRSTFALYGPAGEIMANTAVKTITSNLVGGEDLEKAFLTALASSFASYANNKINAEELDEAVNIVIAGATGAASAAALGQDPVQGAMTAIVAELANTYLAPALSEEQKKRDGPMVRLAECNYKEECAGSDDYKLLRDEELFEAGIDPNKMIDNDSGYSAKVYHNKELNEYVIVFTGTNDAKDWSTNFAQAFGLVGAQYEQAGDSNILEKLSKLAHSTGGTLAATGHSLGGGLATAVASTGKIDRAVVFNAAGVHAKTIAAIGGRIETARAVTTAYASRADILNNLQDTFRLPSALGTRVVVEAGGLHGIEALVKVFEPD